MKAFKIKIAVQSPLQLGYGKADVIIDSDVVHDKYGMPYFPAKRFKGLLYESALELAEISNEKWFKKTDIDKLFGQGTDGVAQFRINNFYLKTLKEYGELCKSWQYLHDKYRGIFTPQSVLNLYTDIRYQTTIEKETGTTKEGNLMTGERYVDSKEIVGSIPNMLMDTLSLVRQRMNTGAVIQGGLRKDIPDYPLIAVREAVANALQHRDYSQGGRGSQVQVNLYSDRLEIINPGGLYGSTTVESLGKEGISSTRNEFLSRLLTYTPFDDGYVVENKGTGFMTIESSLAAALMPPPKVHNSLTFFKLTFEKRRKTEEEISERSWKNLEEAILSELEKCGSASTKELMAKSGYSRQTIINHVKKMVKTGFLEPIEPKNSPKQRYRLVRK